MRFASNAPEPTSEGTQTFVIRIWSSDGADALRGHIQHVRSRKRACFTTREHLLSLIEGRLLGVEHGQCQH